MAARWRTWFSVVREYSVDVALLGGAFLSFLLLLAVARMLVFYIFCGLTFMGVAAYTVSQRGWRSSNRAPVTYSLAARFAVDPWANGVKPRRKTRLVCVHRRRARVRREGKAGRGGKAAWGRHIARRCFPPAFPRDRLNR